MVSRRVLIGVGVGVAALVVLAGVAGGHLAQQRALGAEETYVAAQLSGADCLENWRQSESAGLSRDASVEGVSPSGVRVAVTVPYTYETTRDGDSLYAHTASEAVHVVSLTGTDRVEGAGVDPC